MAIDTFEITNVIKDMLYCETWKPEGKPKSVMLLVHGLGEHCNRYKGDFSQFFTENGMVIYTFDLPGHGLSGGKRGHLRDQNDLHTILENRLVQIKADYPELPVFIYGHSLGGLISASFLAERHPKLHGAILSAPAFAVDNPLPPAKVALAKAMDRIFPTITLDSGLNREMLSHDPQVIEKYNNDPLVHGLTSARLGAYIINKGKFIRENPQMVKTPTLVMVGGDEAIVSKAAIHAFCEASPLAVEKIWDGMYHEIHNEKGKQEVFQFAFRWMKEKM